MKNDRDFRARTLRDLAASAFRRRRLVATSFIVIFLITAVALILQPNQYESEMKILVKRGRLDPTLALDSRGSSRDFAITEQEVSSEIELLRSRDLLEQAVSDCQLHEAAPKPFFAFGGPADLNASAGASKPEPTASEGAVRRLEEELQIVPLRGSNLIAASYASKSPEESACVLNALAKRYIDKHLSVHRSVGAYEFFRAEADRYRQELTTVENQLIELGGPENLVASGIDREITSRRLGDLSSSLIQKKTTAAEIQARIRDLERQAVTLKDRQTTEIRTRPDPRLADLESNLMTLRMKRLDMLAHYSPGYRGVQDLDRQISEVQQAVEQLKKAPVTEESTNRDPAFEWVRLELTKARAELAALNVGTPLAARAAEEYRNAAAELEKREMKRQDLLRMSKVAEENYLLYLRKQEEARISDALDRERIVNVAIAEAAMVPTLPQTSQAPVRFTLAAFLAALLSMGLALGADYAGRAFHRPNDIEAVLALPAVAAYPKFDAGETNQGATK